MDLYSLEKLIPEARKLAAEYRKTTGQSLGVSVEIALYDVASLMSLELVEPGTKGYDAVGTGEREGQRILIKGRAIFDESKQGQRIGQLKQDKEWDSVMLLIMDEDYEPVEIYEADRDVLEDHFRKSHSKNNKGAISIAKFRIIGTPVWTREEGVIEDEIWTNR